MYASKGDSDFYTTLGSVFLIALLVCGAMTCEAAACGSRWERSGLTSSWGPVQGCLVNLPDGRWLPEDRVREIDIHPKASP